MWATAELIEAVGCDNVHLRCDATDVSYVEQQYKDGTTDLTAATACLAKKCSQSSLLDRSSFLEKRKRLKPSPLLAEPGERVAAL